MINKQENHFLHSFFFTNLKKITNQLQVWIHDAFYSLGLELFFLIKLDLVTLNHPSVIPQ